MDLIDRIQQIASQASKQLDHIETEEATKNALIMPFINALGYNVFDPTEVVPEFTADVGIKKGEKVDYAIMRDGETIMLFECKTAGTDLGKVHASQLYRYFSVTKARIGILTNGLQYQFYSDLEDTNKMDDRPFLIIDLMDLNDAVVTELKQFTKSGFDIDELVSNASDLKYTREIKRVIAQQLTDPDEEFVRLVAGRVYSGRMTQSVREQFEVITKRALKQFINDQVNARLQTALSANLPNGDDEEEAEEPEAAESTDTQKRQIVTTQEEIDAYMIIKSILREDIDVKRIVMRDAKTYCSILLDDTNRKPICRLYFNSLTNLNIRLVDEERNETRYDIETVDDIYQYADRLKAVVARYESEG